MSQFRVDSCPGFTIRANAGMMADGNHRGNAGPITQSGRRIALVLGLVSMSSPLAVNMYVPEFSQIAADLRTDSATVQLTLAAYFIAMAIGQNIHGPLSDRLGRKTPLYLGLAVLAVASVAASFSRSIEELIVWRFVQGIGGCACMAIPRAVIRDLHTGPEAARMLAMTLLVVSIAPLIAPLAGSGIGALFSWRAIFWVIGAVAALNILSILLLLPETWPPAARTSGGISALLASYKRLLKDRRFMALTLVTSFAQAAFFAYVGGSPTIFMTLYGLEPWQFGLLYSVGGAAWAGSAQFAAPLMTRYGPERLIKATTICAASVTFSLLIATVASVGGLWLLSIAVVLMFIAIGLVMPTVTVLALHPHGAAAGTASALIGTTGFALSAVASTAVSVFDNGTAVPMVSAMAACTLMALGTAWLAFASDPGADHG